MGKDMRSAPRGVAGSEGLAGTVLAPFLLLRLILGEGAPKCFDGLPRVWLSALVLLCGRRFRVAGLACRQGRDLWQGGFGFDKIRGRHLALLDRGPAWQVIEGWAQVLRLQDPSHFLGRRGRSLAGVRVCLQVCPPENFLVETARAYFKAEPLGVLLDAVADIRDIVARERHAVVVSVAL